MKTDRLRSICFSVKEMAKFTFENAKADQPQFSIAQKYVEEWNTVIAKNIGLLFWGTFGTGKTYTAACIANALIEKEVRVRMTSFTQIMHDLYAEYDKNRHLEELDTFDLLIVDDLGIERATDYSMENKTIVLERRLDSKKPLIITTNMTLHEMKAASESPLQRIHDRIFAACAPIQFTGEDIRAEQHKEKIHLLQELLNER